jgi:thiaminase
MESQTVVSETMEVESKKRKTNVFHVKKDIRFVEDQIKVNKRLMSLKKSHKGQEELLAIMQQHQTNLVHYHKRLCQRVKAAYEEELSEMAVKSTEIEASNI